MRFFPTGATVQAVYDNSTSPEIITSPASGSFTLRRGSGADTDDVLEVQNGAGALAWSAQGDGVLKWGTTPTLTAEGQLGVNVLTGHIELFTDGVQKAISTSSRNFSGLRMSLSVAFPLSRMDIAVGTCRDEGDIDEIEVNTPLTADITASGVNGLDTGSEAADTFYSLWVIADSTGVNATASLFSISATSPTLPGGYDLKRRVGWARNDASSDFLQGRQQGDSRDRHWYYDEILGTTQVLSLGSATTPTNVLLSNFVPPSSEWVQIHIGTNGTSGVSIRPGGFTTFVGEIMIKANTGAMEMICPNQTVEYENTVGGGATDISVVSYQDSL